MVDEEKSPIVGTDGRHLTRQASLWKRLGAGGKVLVGTGTAALAALAIVLANIDKVTESYPRIFGSRETAQTTGTGNSDHPIPARITIPLRIVNELSDDARINQSVEYYLTRPSSPATEGVIESGAVRIPRPDGFTRINELIAIAPRETLNTSLELPASLALSNAMETGGFHLKVVVKNDWPPKMSVPKDVPFDPETVSDGIRIVIWKKTP